MLVTQADYMRWQNMYGQRNNSQQVEAGKSTATTGQSTQPIGGQDFAASATKTESEGSSLSHNEQEKSFLEVAYERLLMQRLGIDQDKMNEIEEEIEKTENAIKELSEQQPHTADQKRELESLEETLAQLQEALKELVKQANERKLGENPSGQKVQQIVGQYQTIASLP